MKHFFSFFVFIACFAAVAFAQQTNVKAIKRGGQSSEWEEYPLNTVKKTPAMDADKSRGMLPPSLRVYLPDPAKSTGRMVIALPGGGYQNLAVFHEGFDWAPYFLSRGIALAVLKYRMPQGNPSIPFADVRAAFDLVKQHAAEWHINPGDIGIMGASAGGHLASTYATHTTGTDRPAFQILLYPVITMDETFTHTGSRKNLLGENPSKELINKYSNDKQVTQETPRAFIIFAADDKAVPPKNGFRYVEALQQNNIPVTFLLYPEGGHGFGYRESYSYHSLFLSELSEWLKGF
ncbi:MAG: alpha/beta hydrolase [Petrimonas sp.]|nr:alpha/beta hydrolase [Petrimonas sp.]